jgi:hypothetical protein
VQALEGQTLDKETANMDRVQRREMLIKYFNDSELRALCFELNVEYEDLGGTSRSAKALELVTYCERHGLTPQLEAALLAREAKDQATASRAAPDQAAGPSARQAAPAALVEAFADLEIRIRKREEAGYPVEMKLDENQVFPIGYMNAAVTQQSPTGDLVTDGQQLYAVLLADSALRANWAEARGRSRRRRLRLWIDVAAPELHTIPWEQMHEELSMLSADRETPFSRFLPVNRPWSGPIHKRPIHVLVAISNPQDLEDYSLPQVDVELERKALETAFAAVGTAQLQTKFLEAPVTLGRLEKELLQEQYHILHFLGHGAYSARLKQATLYLEDEQRKARRVSDTELAGLLDRQGAQPQLVLLAACQGAARSTSDAFLGLGPKLVMIGAPAVVAMQATMSLTSARMFSAALYERLLAHGLIDLAANEARGTLLTAGRPDAAVPVLFMRLRDGRLWDSE